MKKYLPDYFITGLLLTILIAWLKPGLGMDTHPVNLGMVINIGLILVFFFQGLKLDIGKIQHGMKNWLLHVMIQFTTFFVFSLIVLLFYPLLGDSHLNIFWMGMFFLAALPSTVSSSVVLVSIAGGNIPAAIFNAGISGLIGIIMTPFWMGLFIMDKSMGIDFTAVLLKLLTQIILPVVVGLVLNKFLKQWTNKLQRTIAIFERIMILLVVYKSFSHSFMDDVFSSVSLLTLGGVLLSVILLFFLVLNFTGLAGRWLHFSHEDRITMQFAGTQKSLVHGSVYANILFRDLPAAGILLLPVIIYHGFQLIVFSIIAEKMRKEKNR